MLLPTISAKIGFTEDACLGLKSQPIGRVFKQVLRRCRNLKEWWPSDDYLWPFLYQRLQSLEFWAALYSLPDLNLFYWGWIFPFLVTEMPIHCFPQTKVPVYCCLRMSLFNWAEYRYCFVEPVYSKCLEPCFLHFLGAFFDFFRSSYFSVVFMARRSKFYCKLVFLER